VTAVRQVRAGEGARFKDIRVRALTESPTAFSTTAAEDEQRPLVVWEERASDSGEGLDRAFFVAEDGDRWVGIAGGIFDDPGGDVVMLVSMWVDPAYRRQGLARKLTQAVLSWARRRGARGFETWVNVANTRARALYRSLGLQPTGRIMPMPNLPAETEEHLSMAL
jgi:GNAT superfamily N-acetyltransferase